MFLKKIAAVLTVILLGVLSYSQAIQPTVNVSINKAKYKVGDTIEALVSVADNPGLHSLFFDLQYDSEYLSFDGIYEGNFFNNLFGENEFLYAVSDPVTAAAKGGHLIVSYTLKGNGTTTKNTGTLIKLKFSAKKDSSGNSHKFTFANSKIIDGNGTEIGTLWKNSDSFSLYSSSSGVFILIKKPNANEVLYNNDATVDVICSNGDYKIKLLNNNKDYVSPLIDVKTGYISNQMVPLDDGNNVITAELYDSIGKNKIISNSILVYKESNKQKLNIIDPIDHSLLNTDTVDVIVSSSLKDITVNGIKVDPYSTDSNGIPLHKATLFLKNGFNTIIAKSITSDKIVYQDSIVVYFQKDKSLFSIVSPYEGKNYKSSAETKLIIKGEIDSLKTFENPEESGPIENSVTLSVYYTPKSGAGSSRYIILDKKAVIRESDYSDGLERSKYMFINDFDIKLDKLENGTIDIYAYKNKNGNNWEDMVKRTIYIDDNRLWIDLVQPNIFTYDSLDTLERVKNFNSSKDLSNDSSITLSNDGCFILKENAKIVEKVKLFYNSDNSNDASEVIDIAETSDGNKYLIRNVVNEGIEVYRKKIDENQWKYVTLLKKKFGYRLCAVSNYVLIGTSNMEVSTESDLFIIDGEKIYNVKLPEVIKNIQFIINKNENIYLYGDNFFYLYKFNIYNIIKSNNGYKIDVISKDVFNNNFTIKQFDIVNEGETGIIRTDLNKIFFYKKTSNGYIKIDENPSGISGNGLVCGEYKDGDYNAIIIPKFASNEIEVIMQNKKSSKFYVNSLKVSSKTELFKTDNITLCSVGYKDDYFIFILKDNSDQKYYIKKGQIFFKNFYKTDEKIYQSNFSKIGQRMFIDSSESLFTGFDMDNAVNQNLYFWYTQYPVEGFCDFSYVNGDIEGITGIEFAVDPIYRSSNSIKFGYDICDNNSKLKDASVSINKKELSKLIDLSTDSYVITDYYDSSIEKQVFYISFNKLISEKIINFHITLQSKGDSSPSIYNLKVYKKISAKISYVKGVDIIVPIHGYVYDKTVTSIYVDGHEVSVGRDGSFYYDYHLNTTSYKFDVELKCSNSIGEEVVLKFSIKLVESQNNLSNIKIKRATGYGNIGALESTTDSKLLLSGKYWGLIGASVGYELYNLDNTNDPIRRGLFVNNIKTEPLPPSLTNLGSEYMAASFSDVTIDLVSGTKILKIYCENPGGLRYEYKINGQYPRITYNMSLDKQRIIISNLTPINENKVIEGVPVLNKLELNLNENSTAPYYFSGTYQIYGEVESVYDVEDLKIKSYTNGLTFSGDKTELLIPVDASNRFNFTVNIKMQDIKDVSGDFYVGIIPTLPFLSSIKTGIKICANKSLYNTKYIPDFSEMNPIKWTEQEKKSLEIPVKVKFNRGDLPRNLKMELLFNYEKKIEGTIDLSGDYYRLKDNSNKTVSLSGVKNGINRLQWKIWYGNEKVSSSASSTIGMSDYLFEYHGSETTVDETTIDFSPSLSSIKLYNYETLPKMNIRKDKTNEMSIFLNGKKIWEDINKEITSLVDYSIDRTYIVEGRNIIKTLCKNINKEYEFVFDSKVPVVNIESYSFTNYTSLTEITGNVVEANFSNAYLYYGDNVINMKPDITIKDNDKYILKWKDLSGYDISPSAVNPVKIEVIDMAGNRVFSDVFTGYNSIERAEEDNITKQNIDLSPDYNVSPVLKNEVNYKSRLFSSHVKFMPKNFLRRIDIKDSIAGIKDKQSRNNYLIRNFLYEYAFMGKDESGDEYFYFTDKDAKPIILDSTSDYYLLVGEDVRTTGKVDFNTFVRLDDGKFRTALSRAAVTAADSSILNIFGLQENELYRTNSHKPDLDKLRVLFNNVYYNSSVFYTFNYDLGKTFRILSDNSKVIEISDLLKRLYNSGDINNDGLSGSLKSFYENIKENNYDQSYNLTYTNYTPSKSLKVIDKSLSYSENDSTETNNLYEVFYKGGDSDIGRVAKKVKTKLVADKFQGTGTIEIKYYFKNGDISYKTYSLYSGSSVVYLERNDIEEIYIQSIRDTSSVPVAFAEHVLYLDDFPIFKFNNGVDKPEIYTLSNYFYGVYPIWPSNSFEFRVDKPTIEGMDTFFNFTIYYSDGSSEIVSVSTYGYNGLGGYRGQTSPGKRVTKIDLQIPDSDVDETQEIYLSGVYLNGTKIYQITGFDYYFNNPQTIWNEGSFFNPNYTTNQYTNSSSGGGNWAVRFYFSDGSYKDITYNFLSNSLYDLGRNDVVSVMTIPGGSSGGYSGAWTFLYFGVGTKDPTTDSLEFFRCKSFSPPPPYGNFFSTNITNGNHWFTTKTSRFVNRDESNDEIYYLQYHTTEEWDRGGSTDSVKLYYHLDSNNNKVDTTADLNFIYKYKLIPQHKQRFYVAENSSDMDQRAKFILAPKGIASTYSDMLATAGDFTFDNSGYGKYIVFKFQENMNITDETCITNKIKFNYIYSTQDVTGNIIEKTESLEVNSDKSFYVNGDGYVYYIVEASEIKNKFKEKNDITGVELNNNEVGKRIYDRGSVRIQYIDNISPESIYLIGDSTTDIRDLIVYDTAYEDSNNKTSAHSSFKVSQITDVFNNSVSDCKTKTIGFWFRVEDEAVYNAIYKNNYKRILTFCDNSEDLYSLTYKAASVDFMNVNGQYVSLLPSLLGPLSLGGDAWNLFIIEINNNNNTIGIRINNGSKTVISLPSSVISGMLSTSGKYYFGDRVKNYNTGFYSIAKPFYIDKMLNSDDINLIFNLKDVDVTNDLRFNGLISEIGDKPYQLNRVNGTDHLSFNETADFKVNAENKAFKLSNKHSNLLEKSSQGFVEFKNAECIKYNIKLTDSNTALEPEDNSKFGYYYFGNNDGNYGLKYDKYYSISGFVKSVATNAEASLVLRINGKEQEFSLRSTGFFHFVYDNKENLIPQDVKLFIKTKGKVVFESPEKIVFNEGNYVLPSGNANTYELEKSSLKFKYEFGLSGTVSFWFKPINLNKNGYVNYDAVLFDSEYIKIGSKVTSEEEDAVYYAVIKNESGNTGILINTDAKVTYDWQHIQLSYDTASKIVYFYLNGKMVGKSEGISLPKFGSLLGNVPATENVFIGSDRDALLFAEGYLDEIKLLKKYRNSTYLDETKDKVRNPINLKEETTGLKIEGIGSCTINECSYIIETIDGNTIRYEEPGSNTFIPFPDESGRYRLTLFSKVNGFKHKNILLFNVDNKPKFELKDNTPIIFTGVERDIWFKFSYDNSYQFSNDRTSFSGIAAKIDEKFIYLTQDFINQDYNNWIMGTKDGQTINWVPVTYDNSGLLTLTFKGLSPSSDLTCKYKYFYFDDVLNENNINSTEKSVVIPIASLSVNKLDHKISVSLNGVVNQNGTFPKMEIRYITHQEKNGVDTVITTGNRSFNGDPKIDLYYDDLFISYGANYKCTIELLYNNVVYDTIIVTVDKWSKNEESGVSALNEKRLNINEFSVMYLDKNSMKAGFYLEFDATGDGEVLGDLYIMTNQKEKKVIGSELLNNSFNTTKSVIIEGVLIPSDSNFMVTLSLQSTTLVRTSTLYLTTKTKIPEICLTNSVNYYIPFNNVFFSWIGYYEGKFNSSIKYSHQFDEKGYTNFDSKIRSINFYNLAEGRHKFEIKADYSGTESVPKVVNFFVDTKKPIFDASKIKVEKIYDDEGIFNKVNIIGEKGAVIDVSLKEIRVNNKKISSLSDGSFVVTNIPVTIDGLNHILVTAYDNVNNYTDYQIEVDNTITSITYPSLTTYVKYSPLTVVGKINSNITTGMDIYLYDPMCSDKGDGNYTGWKKAKVNEDRTFFVEDVFVNPGSEEKGLVTTMKLACVSKSGKVFTREIDIRAKNVQMPIDMKLSTHTAEGENTDTYVEIDCKANVPNISSWGIDFNGDGIYDDIYLVPNSDSSEAKSHKWTYKYSSVGIIKPRVRVVTKDNCFFSTSDTIIIHKKIIGAASQMVYNPIGLSSVSSQDGSKLLFVLRGTDCNYFIDFYEVPKNTDEFIKKQYNINLTSLNVNNPVKIRAINRENIIVATNNDGVGYLYQLVANSLGNYQVEKDRIINFQDEIRDIAVDDFEVNISFINSNQLKKLSLCEDKRIDKTSCKDILINTDGIKELERMSGIARDGFGLLISDYLNQRVLRYSKNNSYITMIGESDRDEIKFVKPMIVKAFENRIFVYDESKKDIQIFDQNFVPITTLKYNVDPQYDNYLENGFLVDIADMDIITKEENGGLIYYGLVLSKTSNKLAMIRLPQWDELRARVRNNKIVFIQNGEIYCAKPDGGDMIRLLSTDSRPYFEGQLDYPALSADGRKLVFTSKQKLYNGVYTQELGENSGLTYTNMYVYDIEKKAYEKVNLGNKNGYEIERPQFNSNGDKIVFSAKNGNSKWKIYEYDTTTLTIKNVFDPLDTDSSQENLRFPYFSPDDKYLVFTTDYDGDYDVKVVELSQISKRISVTSNTSIDTYPVWASVFPNEIKNSSLKIESKIAFVSDRKENKGVYYSYVKGMEDSAFTIVKSDGTSIEDNPDSAAIGVSKMDSRVQSNYPCFTGDGKAIIYEYADSIKQVLKKKIINDNSSDMNFPESAIKPSGMKNMITGFAAENKNSNEIELKWNRYSDQNIKYQIQYKINKAEEKFDQFEESNQEGSTIKGREMGSEYLVRVCVIENREEVATSQWKTVKMKDIIAKPSFEINSANPYLVKLKAWKPKPETQWYFTWKIDNINYDAGTSTEWSHEFGTSGIKTIQLKASNKDGSISAVSDPFTVNIVSDIDPVIEYNISSDSSYIELSAAKSKGKNIDFSATTWQISGPGSYPVQATGKSVIMPLNGFLYRVDVKLSLKRILLSGQQNSDIIEKNVKVDLKFSELMPAITTEVDTNNNRIIKFTAENSQGNIDWQTTRWTIFENGNAIYSPDVGTTAFTYSFPEYSKDVVYAVSLVIKRKNDGTTKSTLKEVCIDATPIVPEIKHEVLLLKEGDKVVGAKILFDCTQSKGNNIDYSQAKWNVPVSGSYGEQEATQYGPTAIYNLSGIDTDSIIDVNLTLSRKGGSDPVTKTEKISIGLGEKPQGKLIVSYNDNETNTGTTIVLDVYKSTGPNIEWEKTEWLINGQYSLKGPMIRYDVPFSEEKTIIPYVCTLYRTGMAPETYSYNLEVGKKIIIPVISSSPLSSKEKNVLKLSVLDSKGANIDWEKTTWYIYDGNEVVSKEYGATVTHAFSTISSGSNSKIGYSIMVEMFLKGSSYPFVGYKSVDIEYDELTPVITVFEENDNIFTFTADSSKGSNIDWSQAKWTFGDSSESQYGPTVIHQYPVNSVEKEYTVTLTLTRKANNGVTQTKMTTKRVKIGKDEIEAVVNAKLYGNYLILSAEDSKGKGLLLDRSTWYFHEGEGDSYSYNKSIQGGTIKKSDYSSLSKTNTDVSGNFYVQGQVGASLKFPIPMTGIVDFGADTFVRVGGGLNINGSSVTGTNKEDLVTNYDYSNYKNDNESFSTSSTYTGVVCRKNVEGQTEVIITLFVYRVSSSGGMEGQSITVKIDLNGLKQANAVSYK